MKFKLCMHICIQTHVYHILLGRYLIVWCHVTLLDIPTFILLSLLFLYLSTSLYLPPFPFSLSCHFYHIPLSMDPPNPTPALVLFN